jgi:hypothetical protein
MQTAAGIFVAALLLVAGCGGRPTATPSPAGSAGNGAVPVIVSSEEVVGPNRFVFSFVDDTNAPISSPDRTAKVHFVGPGGETFDAPAPMFVWAIEGVSGVYVTSADFPVAGAWTAEFSTSAPGSPERTMTFSFDVKSDAHVVRPGEKAPSVETPTLADVGGDAAKISTDKSPDRAFYETSVSDALAAHVPFVLVFATPAFCQTNTCGPTLDKVKAVARAHPDVTFINVEPYQLELVDGGLQPVLDANGNLQATAATDAYGLLTEPYIFVVGGDGTVKASFELVFTPAEIDEALAKLS